MATQDDINNLISQIKGERQSAKLLDEQITKEQQNSTQLIESWQQQAKRHRETATRMAQRLDDLQRQLTDEQYRQSDEAKKANDKAKNINKGISRGLF